jgi:hypothetical protein
MLLPQVLLLVQKPSDQFDLLLGLMLALFEPTGLLLPLVQVCFDMQELGLLRFV